MSYILTAWIINADIGSMLYQMLFTSSCIFRSHQDALQHKSTNEFLTFTKDHLQILTVLLYCRIPRICYTIAGNLLNDNMSESTIHIKYIYSLEIQISSVTYVDKCMLWTCIWTNVYLNLIHNATGRLDGRNSSLIQNADHSR